MVNFNIPLNPENRKGNSTQELIRSLCEKLKNIEDFEKLYRTFQAYLENNEESNVLNRKQAIATTIFNILNKFNSPTENDLEEKINLIELILTNLLLVFTYYLIQTSITQDNVQLHPNQHIAISDYIIIDILNAITRSTDQIFTNREKTLESHLVPKMQRVNLLFALFSRTAVNNMDIEVNYTQEIEQLQARIPDDILKHMLMEVKKTNLNVIEDPNQINPIIGILRILRKLYKQLPNLEH
ncbi:MAG: hypothetical protein KatS3mg085_715 [Candidatus Dojkabacteria bacterium]|nr:MAG: hypothetical protein KatS3mg085_715 [Candidatus Dojkabacteria bacterium]GIW58764.1 MAG: hypothetical protein KatS3mg086_049 [Candidatus Dojkabacteria bacterium]